MSDNFFDEPKTEKRRFLILSDLKQEMPNSRLKVIDKTKRTSMQGKEYKVLILCDEEGTEYEASAWERDVVRCIQEWGTNPDNWGYLTLEKHPSGNRFLFAPHKNQLPNEEDVA